MKNLFRTTLLSTAFLGLLGTAAIAQNAPQATLTPATDVSVYKFQDPVAKINDREVSKSEFDNYLLLMQGIPLGEVDEVETRELAEQLVLLLASQEAQALEAKSRGLDQDADYQMRIKLIGDLFLADMLLQDMMAKNEISEEALEAQYQLATAAIERNEYQASHILVETLEEAQALLDAINNGDITFAQAAKDNSLDAGTAVRDGSIGGWFRASMMDPGFSAALVAMEKGEMSSEPVQSQFGYHIIVLDDVRDIPVKPFAELDNDTKLQLAQPLYLEKVEELQKNIKVELPESGSN